MNRDLRKPFSLFKKLNEFELLNICYTFFMGSLCKEIPNIKASQGASQTRRLSSVTVSLFLSCITVPRYTNFTEGV